MIPALGLVQKHAGGPGFKSQTGPNVVSNEETIFFGGLFRFARLAMIRLLQRNSVAALRTRDVLLDPSRPFRSLPFEEGPLAHSSTFSAFCDIKTRQAFFSLASMLVNPDRQTDMACRVCMECSSRERMQSVTKPSLRSALGTFDSVIQARIHSPGGFR